MVAQAERQVVLSGDMSDLDIASIMSTLGLSRQVMQLEILDAHGNCEGTIVTKAGRVISATAGHLSGAAAVHRLLETDMSGCFRVVCALGIEADNALSLVKNGDDGFALAVDGGSRDPSSHHAGLPGGNGAAQAPETISGERRGHAVEGTLDTISLAEVLRAIALSRNYVVVEVCDGSGVLSGAVHVKAGQILWAQAGSLRAVDALRELSKTPSTYRFGVFHESRSVAGEHPLGTVDELLQMLEPDLGTTQRGHGGHAGLDDGPSSGVVPKLGTGTAPAAAARPSISGASGASGASGGSSGASGAGFAARTYAGLGSGVRKQILDGRLTELALRDVVLALSTGRQFYEVQVFAPLGQSLGSLELKTDMLIAARLGDEFGVEAARKLLPLSGDYRFAVFTVQPAPKELVALTRLTALIAPAPAPELFDEDEDTALHQVTALTQASAGLARQIDSVDSDDSQDFVVLDGNLAEFDLRSVVQVASASRQHTSVRVLDDHKQQIGALHVKSGMLLRAEAWGTAGAAAVHRLLYCPRDFSFVVLRHHADQLPREPLGRVDALLRDAALSAPPALHEHQRDPATLAVASAAPHVPATAPQAQERAVRVALPAGWLGGAAFGAGFALVGAFASWLIFYPRPMSTQAAASATSIDPTMPTTIVAPATRAATPPVAALPSLGVADPARVHETARADDTVGGTEGGIVAAVSGQSDPARGQARIDAVFGASGSAGLTPPAVASIQAALKHLGYAPGPIDGVIGPRTSAAIQAFQRTEHLVESGVMTEDTRARLSARIAGR